MPRREHTPTSLSSWLFAVVIPLAFIVVILSSDLVEGPKTAYVGVLASIPLLSAIFGSPLQTGIVAIITWLSAFAFGHFASDGNVTAQSVRLVIIAIFSVVAILAAWLRSRREAALLAAQRAAAEGQLRHVQAIHDDLTGLLNRRGMLESLTSWTESPSTLAIIDCDHLKVINDTHGHLAGDAYLAGIAGRLGNAVSRQDLVARWGGDEFIIALKLPFDEARAVLERVHASVVATDLNVGDTMVPASFCCGFAPFMSIETLDESLAAADRAMYEAKKAGPNVLLGAPATPPA